MRGGFRHLMVVDGGDLIGVLSMRDIVRCWVPDGATSEMPRLAEARRAGPGLALPPLELAVSARAAGRAMS